MAKETISSLMIAHHALIEKLLFSFKKELKEKSPNLKNSVSRLKWEVKKHFFLEESAIFDFLTLDNLDIFKMISRVKDEHLTMIVDLIKFSDNIENVADEDIKSFTELLLSHREFEDKILYPKLDAEADEDQKQKIIVNIKQMPVEIDLNK